jgi:hypothetical protein
MRCLLLFLGLVLVSTTCWAQLSSEQGCSLIGGLSREIVQFRAQGGTKQQVIANVRSSVKSGVSIPDPVGQLLDAAYAVIDEVYDYPPLNERAYVAYKMAACRRRIVGGAPIRPFDEAYRELSMCGNLESLEEITECGKKAAGVSASDA